MEPLKPQAPADSAEPSEAANVTPQPGTTFQPVVITPTGQNQPGAATPSTDPDTATQGSSTPTQPADTLQSNHGAVSAWPAEFQNPVQSSPVTSITVPKPGSLTPQPGQNFNAGAAATEAPVSQSTNSLPGSTVQAIVGSASASAESHAQIVNVTGAPNARPSRKRTILLAGGGLVLILALAAGVVFGWYLPNTPANVYNTGINRSGKALDSLVNSAVDAKQLAAYNTSTIKGSASATLDGSKYSGDFSTTFDKTTMNGGLNVTLNDKESNSKTINLKALSKIPDGSIYPDVYFQVTGIKALGLDSYIPGMSAYDGKWISVSSDYIKALSSNYIPAPSSDTTKSQITAADVAELAHTVTTVSEQYLFTTDPNKAVFEKKSFVGKEPMDGLTTYHYKVGVNVEHTKAYCEALTNAIYSTSAVKKLSGETDKELADSKASALKDCADSTKGIESSDAFDMWIDGKYKLIHKIRVYDKTDKNSYGEVGQTYLGGNKLSLFSAFHDAQGKTDGKFTLDTDLKAAKTSAELDLKGSSQDYPYDVTVKVSAAASSQKVEFTKPANPIPIQDILQKFGLDPSMDTVVSPLTPSSSTSPAVTNTLNAT